MSKKLNQQQVQLEPWGESDLDLLRKINAPEMTEHLGGPESGDQILIRHKRYMEIGGTGKGKMFRIVLLPEGEVVGSVGYWERVWQDEIIFETGWSVLPTYQGRGIATFAMKKVIVKAREEQKHRYIHAFPSIHNPASNAICQKLGFAFVGECEFEYPIGNMMRCNDWCLDLG